DEPRRESAPPPAPKPTPAVARLQARARRGRTREERLQGPVERLHRGLACRRVRGQDDRDRRAQPLRRASRLVRRELGDDPGLRRHDSFALKQTGRDAAMVRAMNTIKLGHTGLDVSRICLGCMSYGEPDRGNHPWTLGEAASRPFIRKALDLGINFFDTANVYSDGTSEEIVGAIDASLKRLGTNHVDLYQIHRWDYGVPIEETLEALNDVVRAGKALHIGASSMYAWQFAKALHLSDRHGWARFATM